jgi:Leucine-rich repeat (LRR) protein
MTNDAVLKIIEQAAEEGGKKLNLSGYGLTELPEEIYKLKNLTELDLSYNQISVIPDAIAELKNMTKLYLWNNQISEISEGIIELENLAELGLGVNQISKIPNTITKLKNLTELYLTSNQISEIPDAISELKKLKILDLSDNQIREIPEIIMQLENLERHQDREIEGIDITGNPIINPPYEIVEKGIYAIRAYFLNRQLSHYQHNNALKIERSIEFPPEYWTAGNSILSYFSHILSVNYPDQNIKVKIEQEGLLLRMIIDTSEGTTETIEQAFNDYVMVISRKLPPESLLTDPFEVMALKNKLQITEMELRISRENFAAFKDDSRERINSLEIQINQFYNLFGKMIENLPHNPVYMNQFANHNQNANIANQANQINDHGQQNANHFSQNQDKNTDEILKIITSLRQISSQFPPQHQEDILIDLEDVETELQKPESDRNLPKLKKRLMALLTASTIIAAPVANLTDFTNNITDLAQKAGIGLLH